MSNIRVGQAVRYIAKEPPLHHDRPRRGDIGHVSQMNADKTRAQLGGLGVKGAIWVDVDALEVVSEKDPFAEKREQLPETKPAKFVAAPKPERVVLPSVEPKRDPEPAPDPVACGEFAPCSQMPEELAWPALDGVPLEIGDPVLVPHGGGRGGRDQLRTGHVIGCCVKGSEQCAIVSIGSSFRAFPITGLIKVPETRLLMSHTIRSKLEAFADGLTPEQRKHMLAIMRGMA